MNPLMAKALAHRPRIKVGKASRDEIEVVLAYLKEDISQGQLLAALGIVQGALYSRIFRVLRSGFQTGAITIAVNRGEP